ncbi:MAG: acyl-ACP--UDP-N-acetylglucosamine O-acyltransferase [Candidatus Adiutrix sp.]|jgi:UDP-N-acetylglucosamine acyltransferase|nr:acyl-ACP--UDP-N-acetylglucosamine O-acyltransferase [Candidatus Adiutrix sp.]
MSIHPTAVIDSSAVVDPTAEVGAYAVIGPRTVVGPEVEIRPHVVIDKDTTIGRGSRIFSFASVGGDPQDLKYKGERTSLVIGENVTIRESSTIHRGTIGGGGATVIGDGCLLMATVHVAHDCHLGPEIIMSSYAVLAGHITIGEGAIIGGLTGIHQFCRVGAHAFIGGFSGLSKDMPPYMCGAGDNRRLVLTGPNAIGLRRRGMPQATIDALKSAFHIICRNRRPLGEVLAEAEAGYGTVPEVRALLDFYRSSKRGVWR